jgi:hypothetical protein
LLSEPNAIGSFEFAAHFDPSRPSSVGLEALPVEVGTCGFRCGLVVIAVVELDWDRAPPEHVAPSEHNAPSELMYLGHSECIAFDAWCILDERGLIANSLSGPDSQSSANFNSSDWSARGNKFEFNMAFIAGLNDPLPRFFRKGVNIKWIAKRATDC